MKRALIVGIPLLAVAVLWFLLTSQQTGSNTLVVDERDLITPVPLDIETDSAIAAEFESPPVPTDTRPAEVTRLADGDSFDIRWTDTDETDEVRLLGINAPESNACFGSEARGFLESLTTGATLQIQETERDEFGRAISNVWAGDVFVNATMVRLGAALALSDQGAYADLIRQAQDSATSNQAGLWDPAFCGSGGTAELAIVDIVADAPGQDNLNPNGEWIDVLNLSQNGADMSDWSIRDESTRHRYDFPDGFVLGPEARVRVFSGCGDDTADSLYWCDGDPVWNNGGDTGFLVDPDGGFVDTFAYSG